MFPSWLTTFLARMEAIAADERLRDAEPNAPEPDDEPDEPEILESTGIKTVGVWTGMASLRNPTRDVEFCRKNGINRMDVIVNDHSRWRESKPFTTHNIERILRLCSMAQAAGIETHLMSWIMPHAQYIDEAADQLLPLAAACKAKSIQWDAEEPWTQARGGLSYPEAAKRIADAFSTLKCPMGVNGIGYTPTRKFGPIAEVCEYLVPQAYATRSSGLKPERVAAQFYRRYRKKFGNKRIEIGLAAYRQKGIPGHTIDSAMRSAVAGAQSLEDVDTVLYWSLSWIRKNRRAARVIRSIRSPVA